MFTGWVFWAYLAASALIYWALPLPRWRNWYLFLASAGYLATLDWKSVVSLLVWSGVFYLAGQKLRGRIRFVTLLLILGILSYLAYFKYFPAIHEAIRGTVVGPRARAPADAILVPLGASYFTFKLIHYILESSRKNVPDHEPDVFLAYLFFFPMFTAGPIERFDSFLKNRSEKFSRELLVQGMTRIIYGLIKKFVIVDLVLARQIQHDPENLLSAIPIWNAPFPPNILLQQLDKLNPLFVWQFLINHFISIYFDFSAYSDIAVGAGLLFGIRLCENFEYPLLATNVGDFWKRWHMSLSGWCQQYVYLPTIGLTRNPYLAVYLTMLAIGLWHAGNLNYICWGLFQGTALVTYLTWGRVKRKMKWKFKGRHFAAFGWIFTFLLMTTAQAFPATNLIGFQPGLRIMGALFGIHIPPS